MFFFSYNQHSRLAKNNYYMSNVSIYFTNNSITLMYPTIVSTYFFLPVISIHDVSFFSRHSMLEYLYKKVIYISTGYTTNTPILMLTTNMLAYWYILYN